MGFRRGLPFASSGTVAFGTRRLRRLGAAAEEIPTAIVVGGVGGFLLGAAQLNLRVHGPGYPQRTVGFEGHADIGATAPDETASAGRRAVMRYHDREFLRDIVGVIDNHPCAGFGHVNQSTRKARQRLAASEESSEALLRTFIRKFSFTTPARRRLDYEPPIESTLADRSLFCAWRGRYVEIRSE